MRILEEDRVQRQSRSMGNQVSGQPGEPLPALQTVGTVKGLALANRLRGNVKQQREEAATRIQSIIRQRRAEQELIAKKHAAMQIQLREKHKRDMSAALAHAQRQERIIQRHQSRLKVVAATTIQCMYRRWSAVQALTRQRSARQIQHIYRKNQSTLRMHREARAALAIEKVFRGMVGRRRANELLATESYKDKDSVTQAEMEHFSRQTLSRITWGSFPSRLLLDTCLEATRRLLLGSDRWDAAISERFNRLAVRGRILCTQFRSILDITAKEQYYLVRDRAATAIQRVFRGWVVRDHHPTIVAARAAEQRQLEEQNYIQQEDATLAAARIQRFMRVATAQRKHRRKQSAAALLQRSEWNSSTILPTSRTYGNLSLATAPAHRRGRSGKRTKPSPKTNRKKISPVQRRQKLKKKSPARFNHNRKDSALEQVAQRAADWTLKTGFNSMMYTSSQESHQAAASAAHEILALQILHNLNLPEQKPVLGSNSTASPQSLHSNQENAVILSLNPAADTMERALDHDPYSALQSPEKRTNHRRKKLGRDSFSNASIDSDDLARSPIPQNQLYPSEKYIRNQEQDPLRSQRDRRNRSLSALPTLDSSALKNASPQERARLRLRQRKQQARLEMERIAAEEKLQKERKRQYRAQQRNSKQYGRNGSLHKRGRSNGVGTRGRKSPSKEPTLTPKQAALMRWFQKAGTRIDEVYEMMQQDKVSEIVADWMVEAAQARNDAEAAASTRPGVFAPKQQSRARTEAKRRGTRLLKDTASGAFRTLRKKLRAALAGLRESDYSDLTAAAKAATSGSANALTPLAIEENNWQNRLIQCLRHKLLLPDAVLPNEEVQLLLQSIVDASRHDADPANEKRAAVLRAPTKSGDPRLQLHEWNLLLRVVDPYGVIDDVANVAVDVGPAAKRVRAWRRPEAEIQRQRLEKEKLRQRTKDQEDETLRAIREKRDAVERNAGMLHNGEAAERGFSDGENDHDDAEDEWVRQQVENAAADAAQAAQEAAADMEANSPKGMVKLTDDDHQGLPTPPKQTTWAEVEKELYGEQDRIRAAEEAAERAAKEREAAKAEAEAAAKAKAARILAEAEAERQRILAEARAEAERIAAEEEERRHQEHVAAEVEAYKRRMEADALAAAEQEAAERAAAERAAAERAAVEKAAAERAAREKEEVERQARLVAEAEERLKAEREQRAAKRRELEGEMAKRIQKFARSFIERHQIRSSAVWRKLVAERDAQRAAAATRCQALVRGHFGRQRAKTARDAAAAEAERQRIAAEKLAADMESYKKRMAAEAEARAAALIEEERLRKEEAQRQKEEARKSAAAKRQRAMNVLGFSLAGAINADAKRKSAVASSSPANPQASTTSTVVQNEPTTTAVDAAGFGPLPANDLWMSTLDPSSNHYYYTNLVTHEVTWDRPTIVNDKQQPDASAIAAGDTDDDDSDDDDDVIDDSDTEDIVDDSDDDGGSDDGNNHANADLTANEDLTAADIDFSVPAQSQEDTIQALETTATTLRSIRQPQQILIALEKFEQMIQAASEPDVLGPGHKAVIAAHAAARSLRIVARVKASHHQIVESDDDDDDDDDGSDSFDDLLDHADSGDDAEL